MYPAAFAAGILAPLVKRMVKAAAKEGYEAGLDDANSFAFALKTGFDAIVIERCESAAVAVLTEQQEGE